MFLSRTSSRVTAGKAAPRGPPTLRLCRLGGGNPRRACVRTRRRFSGSRHQPCGVALHHRPPYPCSRRSCSRRAGSIDRSSPASSSRRGRGRDPEGDLDDAQRDRRPARLASLYRPTGRSMVGPELHQPTIEAKSSPALDDVAPLSRCCCLLLREEAADVSALLAHGLLAAPGRDAGLIFPTPSLTSLPDVALDSSTRGSNHASPSVTDGHLNGTDPSAATLVVPVRRRAPARSLAVVGRSSCSSFQTTTPLLIARWAMFLAVRSRSPVLLFAALPDEPSSRSSWSTVDRACSPWCAVPLGCGVRGCRYVINDRYLVAEILADSRVAAAGAADHPRGFQPLRDSLRPAHLVAAWPRVVL